MFKPEAVKLTYWISNAGFSLVMAMSAVAYLLDRNMAAGFTQLGFPSYFRVELAIAKLIGVCVLLAPLPARVKEWAYAGFAIDLISAVIAHAASGDGARKIMNPAAVGVVFVVSYLAHGKLHSRPST